jgi:hypothetical protein
MPHKDIEEKRKHTREYCRRLRQDPEFYAKQLEKNRQYYQNARNDPEKLKKMLLRQHRWSKNNSDKWRLYKKRRLEKLRRTNPEKYNKEREHYVEYKKQWRRRCRTIEQYMKQLLPEEIKELKRRFVETIEKSAFIGITAKHLEIPESRVYSWMRNDEEFETAVRNAQQRVAEKVGLTLINKAIQTEDTQALIFLCRTLGRNLGFDEKQPMVNINVRQDPQVDLKRLTLDEKENLLQLLRKTQQSESEITASHSEKSEHFPDAVEVALGETIEVEIVSPKLENQ